MKADTLTLQGIFHGDRRFAVPVYQRPYVWNLENQWQLLWDDIEATARRLAQERVAGHAKHEVEAVADQAASPHFLGAIVVEDLPVRTGAVTTRLVVDGQQRLTTLQLLLRGVLDALDEAAVPRPLRAQIRKAIENDREVVEPSESLKLRPRQAERDSFAAAMDISAPEPTASRFAEARCYFRGAAAGFLDDEAVPANPYALPGDDVDARASLLVATLLVLVKLVVIDLEGVDDAQVIFEALNARSQTLSATDLIKNLLFMRAEAQHHDAQGLYESLWKRFDDDNAWWLGSVGVGHAQRVRQDWLVGDWLIAETGESISVGHLYGEFRRWLDKDRKDPYTALSTLNQYADAYERMYGKRSGATARELDAFRRIERLNITVATPLMLWLLVQSSDRLRESGERERAVTAVESFVIRRMAVKAQTRAYGQVFVEVLQAGAGRVESPGQAVIDALLGDPHGYAWPTRGELEDAFAGGRYYGPSGINQDRLRMLLSAIDQLLQRDAPKSEAYTVVYDSLQIEHVMPRSWREHWPIEGDRPRSPSRSGMRTSTASAISRSPQST